MTFRTRLLATAIATVGLLGLAAPAGAVGHIDGQIGVEIPCWQLDTCPPPNPGPDDPDPDDPDPEDGDDDVQVHHSGAAAPVRADVTFTG